MGLRISIGAIIAVLLGGAGYFVQQSQSTKDLLQQREAELSKEKESSAKLRSDIQRFKDIEKKMKGLESRFTDVSTSAKTRMEELSKLVAEKNAAIEQDKAKLLSLATALNENQTTLDNERKARAEETKRLETQAKAANRLIAEKNAGIKQEKAQIRNLKVTLDIINSSLENERKARTETEKSNQQNLELAAKRAGDIIRLETQAKEMSKLVNEKNADIKQRKAQIRSLKVTLDIINSSLENERRMRTNAEKMNQQNIQLAGNQAEEIKRLVIQAEKMSRLIAEKSADIEKGAVKNQNLDHTLKQIEATLENERKARAEEIKGLEAQAQKMSKLVAEKSADIEQEKAKAQKLERTLKQIQTTLENERKTRAEMEKSNRKNAQLASTRARETKRLEKVRELLQTQVRRMRQLIAMKSADIEQEKAKTQKLELALKQIQAALDAERKMRAKAEKASQQNIKLASERAAEIKRLEKARERLETQVRKMRQLIAKKSADIEQEKTKTQSLERALKQIQAALETERKIRVKVERSNKETIELAQKRAAEIKRLEQVRMILETQARKMGQLIKAEQERAKKLNVASQRKAPAKAEKSTAQQTELAQKRAAEMKRLEKTREILNTQVQAMSRLISEKNSTIEKGKTKTQNLELALEQTRKTLDIERKTRTEAEKANARNAELARIRTDEIGRLTKARELQKAQIQEMSQLIGEKTSVAELIKNKLDQTNLSLSETIKKHTLAIARSKVLEKRAIEEAERAKRLKSDLSEMSSKLKEQNVSLQRTKDLLRVTLVNSLLFDSGSARLREKGSEALSKIADFLQKQKDKLIRIEGHTDNRPIKGNLLDRYPSNWELSFARSISIVKFLESKNISPARMSATGHSFYRPVASNNTEEGRARNRRTVILLSSPRPTVEGAAR
ncbi:MAG: OmpA family protein [Nitrospinae bacterium]|nr:OmpA family protein [Nitrospinota bacterium]